MARAPPTIDFSAAYSDDLDATQQLAKEVRLACTDFGFFQLVNHAVSMELQDEMLNQTKQLFDLPLEVKERYSKDDGGFNRGYERLRAQNFEKRTEGDLKEGYYMGRNLPLSHPNVVARKFGQGPNKYPTEIPNPGLFKQTTEKYHAAMTELAEKILTVLAIGLDIEPNWFAGFATDPVAILRMLHYPPQAPDASALERGIGAHTDFGAITILLQDTIGGLQIWDRDTKRWVDVAPTKNAFVINLGNMMMRWTNDRYLSNLHRVINKSGSERYSIPFFFSGNSDFVVKCLPNCEDELVGAKYRPVTVHEWMTGRYADTYGKKEGVIGELASKDAQAGMEAETNIVDCKDDLDVFTRMVNYMYTFKYDEDYLGAEIKADSGGGDNMESPEAVDVSVEDYATVQSQLKGMAAAKTYTIADKYGIIPLKNLAVEVFKTWINENWAEEYCLDVALEAFKSTSENDTGTGLRSAVGEMVAQHLGLLMTSKWAEALKDNGEIACEVLWAKNGGRKRDLNMM